MSTVPGRRPTPSTDAEPDPDAEEVPFERPVDRFRRGAVGGVVAAGLLGLRDALEGRPDRDEVTIVSEAPGQDHRGSLDIQLDPDHPERSVAVIRPPADGGDGAEETGS